MSDNKNVIFRTAMGGYNKNDVNEYILRTSEEFKEKEAFLRERAENAEKETEKLTEELELSISAREEAQKELQNIKCSYEEAVLEKQRLEIKVAELEEIAASANSEKSTEQENIIAKQFEQIDSMREEIATLKEKLIESESESGKSDEIARKALLYDKTSANIGEAIISANKTAEEIVSAAKEEARILTEKAQKELDDKRRVSEETARLAFENIFSKLVSAASESKKEIAASSAYTERILEEAFNNISSRNKNVSSKIKNYEESVWRSIKNDLDSIGISRSKGSREDQNKRLKIK